jgi:glycosyltransferase involved in cell wall biosynthesis
VRALRNAQNLGTVATRNRGLSAIDPQAAYVAVMDADDVALPERLERQVAFLEAHPEHAAVGSQIVVIDEQGRPLGERRYPVDADEVVRVIGRYNPIAHPAATIRRSVLDAVGGYDPRYPRCQDYDLWLRIADRWPLANLDEPLLRYRISSGQAKQKHLRQSLRLTIEIQRKWLLHPRFRSATNLAYFAAEHALLLLPERWVMGLFTRLSYASVDASVRTDTPS